MGAEYAHEGTARAKHTLLHQIVKDRPYYARGARATAGTGGVLLFPNR
jgi:hypothetical protein